MRKITISTTTTHVKKITSVPQEEMSMGWQWGRRIKHLRAMDRKKYHPSLANVSPSKTCLHFITETSMLGVQEQILNPFTSTSLAPWELCQLQNFGKIFVVSVISRVLVISHNPPCQPLTALLLLATSLSNSREQLHSYGGPKRVMHNKGRDAQHPTTAWRFSKKHCFHRSGNFRRKIISLCENGDGISSTTVLSSKLIFIRKTKKTGAQISLEK